MSAVPERVERPLTETIRDMALSGEVMLPPLPKTAQGLLGLLQNKERVDAKKIADLTHADPAIAAALLRMANSAFFGGLQPIGDLTQAVARLGLNRVASLVTTMIHRGQFESPDPERNRILQDLWTHAVASALCCRRLAELVGADAEESYLAGLLHDVGKLLVLRVLDHMEHQNPDFEITPTMVQELQDTTHAELGHRVLTDWRLPESITSAVLLHHDDPETLADELAFRVQAADAITRKIGFHMSPDSNLNLEEEPAIERLNLSEIEVAVLLVDLEDEIEELRSQI